MLNLRKTIILLISSLILYVALVSPKVLPDVTLGVKDSILITIFVILSSLSIRYISMVEAKKLEKEILTQHSQMSTIINNTPLVMYLKEVNGTILLANQRYAELVGISKEKLIGKNTNNLYKNSEEYLAEDLEIARNKKVLIIERTVETSNGVSGWCKLIKAPVFDSSGNVLGIVVVFQNIDHEKELEDRKNTFIATLTHDLKTPTISQIKALDLLLQNSLGPLTELQKDVVSQVKKSCKYMYDLIFTILDTYLYDNGQTKISYEEFDIKELIDETVNEISNLLIEKNQSISIHSDIKSPIVTGDRFQLKRVIINIISNAITYGFAYSDIEILLSENESSVILDITNRSKYIPEEKLIDIFDKFKQASNAKFRKTGTGLGLYLSKQIIDAHHGEIHASSDENETCTFGFSLPKTEAKVISNVS